MKQGTKMSISHFIFLLHSVLPVSLSLSLSPALSPFVSLWWAGDSCWLHENHSSLHLYHKIIDRQEDEGQYRLHLTRLNEETSRPSAGTRELESSHNKRRTRVVREWRKDGQRKWDMSAARDKDQSNKVIKECLSFAHERSTEKPHLSPLPLPLPLSLSLSLSLSLNIAVSIC